MSDSKDWILPLGFPGGSMVKNLPMMQKMWVWSLGWGIPSRYPREGNDRLLQYSCWENPMDRGAWRATVHGVAKSQTWLSDWAEVQWQSVRPLSDVKEIQWLRGQDAWIRKLQMRYSFRASHATKICCHSNPTKPGHLISSFSLFISLVFAGLKKNVYSGGIRYARHQKRFI